MFKLEKIIINLKLSLPTNRSPLLLGFSLVKLKIYNYNKLMAYSWPEMCCISDPNEHLTS
jgi:hypothetical protein